MTECALKHELHAIKFTENVYLCRMFLFPFFLLKNIILFRVTPRNIHAIEDSSNSQANGDVQHKVQQQTEQSQEEEQHKDSLNSLTPLPNPIYLVELVILRLMRLH